jgi:hypothetical protein
MKILGSKRINGRCEDIDEMKKISFGWYEDGDWKRQQQQWYDILVLSMSCG